MTLCALFCGVWTACFAQVPRFEEISVDDMLHTISLEKLDKDPPLLIVKDDFATSTDDVLRMTLHATLSDSFDIKSLTLTVLSKNEYALSGELEWLFPSNCTLSMFGKTRTKSRENGICEITVTFLLGLDDLGKYSALLNDSGTVMLKIYSRHGTARSFKIPNNFFWLLLPNKEGVT